MRKLVGVALAAGLLVSLSACASIPAPAAGTFSSCTSSGNSALVTSKGKVAADPQSEFPTPIVAKKADLTVVSRGDGKQVTADEGVQLVVSMYDGSTGDPVQTPSGPITAVPVRLFVSDGAFPFSEAMPCTTVGSRVVTSGTAEQLFGPQALGLDPKTSIIVVSDIESTFLAKADGADQIPQAGYPSVVLAPNGRPGLTFTSKDIPAGLGTEALKQGKGSKVAEGDSVIANLTGVVWGADKTFTSSWESNAPTTLTVSALAADGSGLVPGLAKALVGAKVGSQLLVVVSGDGGFPSGSEPTGVAAGDTLVYVVDILGISK